MRKIALIAVAVLAVALVPAAGSAVPSQGAGGGPSDIRELDPAARHDLAVTKADRAEAKATLGTSGAATPAVGEERTWLAYDSAAGDYVKVYTLRGVGENVEVWVASDEDDVATGTDFPADDCRNDGARNVITDDQVQYLIDEFDNNMYPIESGAFSVAPPRNGKRAPLAEILGLPGNYYRGPGDRIVALIDNVRDENFYDTDNASGFTYIAGFYTSFYDDLVNRLVMTIDAFDWLHRTGPNPPNEPSADLCENAIARPFLYEGVFAHEYQHLLMNYVDLDETNWVNEGISDYAQTITNYVDPTVPVDTIGQDSHVQCFLGWGNTETPANPIPREGGPENSLTLWGDQTDFEAEILCDYGAAYTFMEYLAGQFGHELLTALHLDTLNGLPSLNNVLDGQAKPLNLIKRWATMVAVDSMLDAGWTLEGGEEADYQTPTLNADINWDNDQAYAAPGVPPNGSDYVRLRDDAGAYLDVDEVASVEFDGVTQLPGLPKEWKVDKSPPKGASKGKALYSGKGDNLDRSIVREVHVGAGNLVVNAAWETEEGYDYAYVQVSDDGGKSYESVECTDSIDAPLGPGFEGDSKRFVEQECDLSDWRNKDVLLAFRYVTDGGVIFDGFWIDDVVLDGTTVSTGNSLKGWSSPTEINPVEVHAFFVRLVAFDETGQVVRIATLPLDRDFDGSVSGDDLAALIGTSGSTVAAIVTYLDPTESVLQTAPYTLTVNGVEQPGG
ncbi:MAG: peptidase M6 [Actinomycetota bacterium]